MIKKEEAVEWKKTENLSFYRRFLKFVCWRFALDSNCLFAWPRFSVWLWRRQESVSDREWKPIVITELSVSAFPKEEEKKICFSLTKRISSNTDDDRQINEKKGVVTYEKLNWWRSKHNKKEEREAFNFSSPFIDVFEDSSCLLAWAPSHGEEPNVQY